MSLYDDIDTDKKSDNVSGWASGIKFLQNHMQPKKVVSQAKPIQAKKKSAQLAPVIDLNKSKYGAKDDLYDSSTPISSTPFALPFSLRTTVVKESKKKSGKMKTISPYVSDPQWQFDNEYDPIYPNDYEKALKDLRDRRDREAEEEEIKRRSEEIRDDDENNPPPSASSSASSSLSKSSIGGVAIAPPQSYAYEQDKPESAHHTTTSSGSSLWNRANSAAPSPGGHNAAARIMAKYGYKEGQGLGKKEQGMATALQVEKTSHRIGRIIHEKDDIRLPTVGTVALPGNAGTPPIVPLALSQYNDDEEMMEPETEGEGQSGDIEPEPLSNPSKVVLLQNMVGPGEVDDDLEPEVKDECQKYGDVVNVTVFQMPDMDGDDAIRIFVEFTRVEAAMKAVIDTNGRFFGGRQVRARFYDYGKYTNLELTE